MRLTTASTAASGPATVVLDAQARLPGRGAYLCREPGSALPRPDCLDAARRCGAVARALKTAVALPIDFVESST